MHGQSTVEASLFAPEQLLQLFATHSRGYTRQPGSLSHRRTCHKSPANLYSRAPSHLQAPVLLRTLRKLYKSWHKQYDQLEPRQATGQRTRVACINLRWYTQRHDSMHASPATPICVICRHCMYRHLRMKNGRNSELRVELK